MGAHRAARKELLMDSDTTSLWGSPVDREREILLLDSRNIVANNDIDVDDITVNDWFGWQDDTIR
jgi:hypothetical protein